MEMIPFFSMKSLSFFESTSMRWIPLKSMTAIVYPLVGLNFAISAPGYAG
jgi:hypothetical protein